MPMKGTIFKGILLILFLGVGETAVYSQQQQRKDTLVVTRDGTGDYRNIQEAVEAMKNAGYREIRLGVDYGNPQSFAFWSKNKFTVIQEKEYIVMQRVLS